MALPYTLFWITPASGQAALCQPCSCDLPPVIAQKALYGDPFRDLPGAGTTTVATGDIIMKMNLQQTNTAQSNPVPPSFNQPVLPPAIDNLAITTIPTAGKVTLSGAAASYPDDVLHADERQSPPHLEDFLIFTDSLGRLCGEFPSPPDARVSWNNTAPPAWVGWVGDAPKAIVAPH